MHEGNLERQEPVQRCRTTRGVRASWRQSGSTGLWAGATAGRLPPSAMMSEVDHLSAPLPLNPWFFLSPVLCTTRNSRRLGKPPNDDSSEGASLAGPRARNSGGARLPQLRGPATRLPPPGDVRRRDSRDAPRRARNGWLLCGPLYEKDFCKQVASLVRNHSGGGRLPDGLQSLIFPPSSQKRVMMPPCVICGRGAWPGCGGGFHHQWTRVWRPPRSHPRICVGTP